LVDQPSGEQPLEGLDQIPLAPSVRRILLARGKEPTDCPGGMGDPDLEIAWPRPAAS
jgi:hypothetical protein